MAKKYSKELLDMKFEVEVLDGTKPERTFFAIQKVKKRWNMYIFTLFFCDNLPTCIDFINVLLYIIVKDIYTIKL